MKKFQKYQYDFIERLCNHPLLGCFSNDVALFIVCQFALESDFGPSNLALHNFNFCGMRSPINRLTFNFSTFEWAQFGSFELCLCDYLLWCSFCKCSQYEAHNLDSFKKFLIDRKYCPESDYIRKINSIYVQFKNSEYGKD